MQSSHSAFGDVTVVQEFLRREQLDGWLLYDFHGLNAVAKALFSLDRYHMTRRWFYYVPAKGRAVEIVHKIEQRNVPELGGERKIYAGWQELHDCLRNTLPAQGTIAMEYSPMNDVPTVSYVDAGMIELIRSFGVNVVSSATLIQEFTVRWSASQLQSHKEAATFLHEAQRQAFALIEQRLQGRQTVNEFEVQQFILQQMKERGFFTDANPIVAVNANASNPHYAPSPTIHSPIRKGDVVLIDLWCKKQEPRSVFADITWMGYAGDQVPAEVQKVFAIVIGARDQSIAFLQQRAAQKERTKGFEVDEVVRGAIAEAGYGEYFVHRTGHSLGMLTHDNGVNIDSYETRDTREITPGVAFSIEPGIYLPKFGVRSEINVYMGEQGPEVHTIPQQQIVAMKV